MIKDKSSQFKSILCIGVEPSLVAYFLSASETLHLSLDTVRTIEDSLEKIESNVYDAYIIDATSSEHAALNLVEQIRQKSGKKCMIALVLEEVQDTGPLAEMVKRGEVSTVLQRPFIPQQIDKFLSDLFRSEKSPSSTSNLEELKQAYIKSTYNKIENLTELIRSVQLNPEKEHLLELKAAVHNMGGSAGSYGFTAVSELCKELDHEISKRISSRTADDIKWLSSLDEFLQKVRKSFQAISVKETKNTPDRATASRPSFFVIDDDYNFLELLKRVKEQFPIELTVEMDPKKAMEQLRTPGFEPSVVIAAQNFRVSPITALDIVEALRQKIKRPIFALLLENDTIETRVAAMQKGIDYIFRKPVSAFVLLKAMCEILESKNLSHVKILVLDDDVDFCNFVLAVLADIGITAKAINDSVELFKTLEEYRPNILLLDLVLPKYDGMHLLKTLRQDIAYKDLVIVIVTSSEETATRINAYSSNADDIIFKPLDIALLQKRVLNLIERKVLKEQTNSLDYTGLPGVKELISALHENLISSNHDDYLVLFELHDFSAWLLREGHLTAKDLLISISNQLQWETNPSMTCFCYNSATFAIVFSKGSLKAIELKMFNFLNTIVQNELKWHLSFDCSITPISKSFGNAQQVLLAAENGLNEASMKEPAPVKVFNLLPKSEAVGEKEVVIIDPDHDLLKILKQAFESHDVKVHTYTEGEPALRDLLSYTANRLPSLIIAERKLPDMDGLDLFLKLKARFRVDIPFYVLTVFSADKDVSEGIKLGILEYIIKPFNISILIQKALKVIFKN